MAPLALTLPAEAASVPAARRFVRECLLSLGAPAACEDAGRLVSELATNAVLHARTPFTVEVSRDGDIARVCVLDLSATPPHPRSYGVESTTGRGMRLVASLASDWGVDPQGGDRKVVWFTLPVSGAAEDIPAWDEPVDVDALLAAVQDDELPGDSPRVAA